MHTIIIRPKNNAGSEPDIVLDLLNHETFEKALTAMGVEHDRIVTLAWESGYSPTVLRRRLSKYPAIKTPLWTRDGATVRNLIPMMLVGAWHARSNADCEILSFLSGAAYDEIEKRTAAMLKFEDCPDMVGWAVPRRCLEDRCSLRGSRCRYPERYRRIFPGG